MGKKHNKNAKKILCQSCKNSACIDRCNVYSCDDYLEHYDEKIVNATVLKNLINRDGLKTQFLSENEKEPLIRDKDGKELIPIEQDFDYEIDGFGPDPDFEIEPDDEVPEIFGDD